MDTHENVFLAFSHLQLWTFNITRRGGSQRLHFYRRIRKWIKQQHRENWISSKLNLIEVSNSPFWKLSHFRIYWDTTIIKGTWDNCESSDQFIGRLSSIHNVHHRRLIWLAKILKAACPWLTLQKQAPISVKALGGGFKKEWNEIV